MKFIVKVKNSKLYVYFLASLSAIIVGMSFLFSKVGLSSTLAEIVIAHRLSFAFIGIFVYRFLVGKKNSIRNKDFLKVAPVAIFYPLFFFYFQIQGLKYATSSLAGILHATVPVFVLIFSSIIREKANTFQKFGIALSFFGVIIVQISDIMSSFEFSLIGGLFILGSVMSLSMYTVLTRKIVSGYDWEDVTYVVIAIGAIFFNILALLMHGGASYISPLMKVEYTLSLLYLGVLCCFVTAYISMFIVTRLTAVEAGVLGSLATIVAVVTGVLKLKESFTVYHFIGTVLIFSGVYLVNLKRV